MRRIKATLTRDNIEAAEHVLRLDGLGGDGRWLEQRFFVRLLIEGTRPAVTFEAVATLVRPDGRREELATLAVKDDGRPAGVLAWIGPCMFMPVAVGTHLIEVRIDGVKLGGLEVNIKPWIGH